MGKVKDYILNNWLFRKLYSIKFYLDLGVQQVSWFIGKFPEIMAIVYLLEKGGITLNITQIIIMAGISFIILTIAGYGIKHTGLYDVERYVDASKNPVTKELLEAARKVNRK